MAARLPRPLATKRCPCFCLQRKQAPLIRVATRPPTVRVVGRRAWRLRALSSKVLPRRTAKGRLSTRPASRTPPALIVSNEMELSRRQAEEEQLQREGVLRKTSSDTGTGEFSNGTISQTSVEVLGQLTADESPSQLGVLGESPRRASTPEGIPGENTSCEFGGTLRRSHDRDSVSVSHDEKRRSARTSIEVKMTRPPEMPRSALRSTPNSRSPSPASDTSYRSCQLDTSSAVGGKKVCFMDC